MYKPEPSRSTLGRLPALVYGWLGYFFRNFNSNPTRNYIVTLWGQNLLQTQLEKKGRQYTDQEHFMW